MLEFIALVFVMPLLIMSCGIILTVSATMFYILHVIRMSFKKVFNKSQPPKQKGFKVYFNKEREIIRNNANENNIQKTTNKP